MSFYVYTLTDPRDGRVFYVGKGKGFRAWQHASEARNGRKGNIRKLDLIRAIHDAGLEVAVAKVAEYEDETDAFDHEADLIASMTGLTNILARGGGWSLTPEEAERRAIERKAIAKKRASLKRREWLKRWIAIVETWPNGGTFPGLKDGDKQAREFLATVRELISTPLPN